MTGGLHELVAAQAARTPDAVAVIGGGRRLTYTELIAESSAVAASLRERGVGRGDLVAVLVDRSPTLVAGMLGVLMTGAGYVPLDPEHPAGRLGLLLGDSGVRLAVCTSELAGALPSGTDAVIVGPGEAATPEPRSTGPTGNDVAYVIYTSGSTGTPKGVAVEHRNIVSLLAATRKLFAFGSDDVWSAFHSAAFDFSVWEIWGPLVSGGRVLLVPRDVARAPKDFARMLVDQRVTVLNQTPTAFRGLARELTGAGAAAPRTSLRLLIFGGEALDVRALAPWFDTYGDDLPLVYNMYGITETTVHVTARRIRRVDLDGPTRSPIGSALAHLRLSVMDPDGRPVLPGQTGEVHVGGEGVARGYLGRPAVTAERFVPDARHNGERLYRTGDLVRVLADGELDYIGRLDEQVKIRGYRVEPAESAAALMRHPDVEAAAVIGAPGPGGETRLVAYVIGRDGPPPSPAVLRAFLEDSVPAFLVPSAYVAMERFPLTPNGKLNRAALPEPGDPGPTERLDEGLHQLGELWREYLGVPPDPAANFFDAGGNSLIAVQMTAAANDLGVNLELADLFEQDTLRDVAAVVAARAAPAPAPPIGSPPNAGDSNLPAGVEQVYPLTALQRGMLYEARTHIGPPRYFVVSSARLTELTALSPETAYRAAYELASRHEALRTTYDLTVPGGPVQWVHRQPTVLVRYLDLRAIPPAELPGRVAAERAAEGEEPLSVGTLPLWRLALCQTGDTEADVILSHWHTVLDGWSVVRLLSQFAEILRAPAPTAKPVPVYRDYVAAERAAAADPVARGFWKSTLARYRPPELPPPIAGRAVPTSPVRAALDLGGLAGELTRTARAHHVPPRVVWLAAHIAVLHGMTPESSPVVITDGRLESADGGSALGLYLNPVPVVLPRRPATWADLFTLIFEAERALRPFRRYPWALMRAEGATGPPELRCCFTYADLRLAGPVGELDERVDTGIPVHVDVTPSAVSVQLDPALTSLAPVDLAQWHVDGLAAAVGHPDGAVEFALDQAGRSWSPPLPDILGELLLAWSIALDRTGIDATDDLRDLGATSLHVVTVAAVLEARLAIPVPAALLMRHPRPADAARALASERSDIHVLNHSQL